MDSCIFGRSTGGRLHGVLLISNLTSRLPPGSWQPVTGRGNWHNLASDLLLIRRAQGSGPQPPQLCSCMKIVLLLPWSSYPTLVFVFNTSVFMDRCGQFSTLQVCHVTAHIEWSLILNWCSYDNVVTIHTEHVSLLILSADPQKEHVKHQCHFSFSLFFLLPLNVQTQWMIWHSELLLFCQAASLSKVIQSTQKCCRRCTVTCSHTLSYFELFLLMK